MKKNKKLSDFFIKKNKKINKPLKEILSSYLDKTGSFSKETLSKLTDHEMKNAKENFDSLKKIENDLFHAYKHLIGKDY